jgi:hypothetical protein
MKKIILDELQRSAWIYLLISLIFLLVFSLFPRREMQQVHRASSLIAYSLLFCGPLLLSFRLQRGFARVILSMPVPKAEAGAACWFFSVAIPMLFFSVITLELFCTQFARGIPVAISPMHLLLLALSVLAYIGTAYFLLTFMPPHTEQGFGRNLKGIFVGALWGLCIGGGVVLGNNFFGQVDNYRLGHYLALAAGLIMTILGFLRSGNMLSLRALPAFVPDNNTLHKTEARHSGSTGLPFLLKTSFRTALHFFFVFFAVILLISALNHRPFSLETLHRTAEHLWPMVLFLVLPSVHWLSGIRHWRSLPISSWKLAATIIAIFAIPTLLMFVAQTSIALLVQNTINMNLLSNTFAWLGVSIVVPGIVLRSGTIKSVSFFFILLVPVAVLFAGYFSSTLWFSLSTFLILGGSGFLLVHLSLTKCSSPYKLNLFSRT